MKKLTLFLFLLIPALGYWGAKHCSYKKTVSFTILHTNDHHGRFWKDRKGRYGMAARHTMIQEIREEAQKKGRGFFLFSAGDVNTGSFESDLLKAEPDFKGMKALGYDVMALGNHEFDHKLTVLRKQESWAEFPFISANIFYEDTGERVFNPYHIFEFDGVKLGVYGLTTELTPPRTDEKRRLKFEDPVNVARQDLPLLKEKTDVLIGLTHLGCYHLNPRMADKTGDILLARKVSGFDMIIGGHSQVALFEPVWVKGTPIVQAKEYGEFIGRIDFDVYDGKMKNFRYQLLPVENIKEDKEILKLLSPYKERARGLGERVIAHSHSFFTGKDRLKVRAQEMPLGNLIGQAYLEKTGADIAIIGGGAIRNDLPEGDITFKTVREILPFGNTLTMATLTGKELKAYFSPIVKILGALPNGAYPQVSGISFTLNKELMIMGMEVGGHPVNSDQKYKIVMDSYLAKREPLYPRLNAYPSFEDTGYVDYLSFIEFLKKRKEISKEEFEPRGDFSFE